MTNREDTPLYVKYVLSGLAGMAGMLFVHPADLVKTRMQISVVTKEYRNTLHCIQSIITREGFRGFYKGVGASQLRQATYGTTRLSCYTKLHDVYRQREQKEPNLSMRICFGMFSGAVGGVVGTPSEVALIRMTTDGRLPPEQRRNYKNVINALKRIAMEEGPSQLFVGVTPTVIRCIVVNATELAAYSHFKEVLHDKFNIREGIQLHLGASTISGLLTSINALPVDIAKTRIQNMRFTTGKKEYTGMFDCIAKIIKNEGFFALWKGFTPFMIRSAPHTILTFIFLEQFNRLYSKYVMGVEGGKSGI